MKGWKSIWNKKAMLWFAASRYLSGEVLGQDSLNAYLFYVNMIVSHTRVMPARISP